MTGSQFKFFRLHYVSVTLCKYKHNMLYLFILMWCWTIFLTNRVMSWLLGSRPLNSVSEHHLSSVSCWRLSSAMYVDPYQLSAPICMYKWSLVFVKEWDRCFYLCQTNFFELGPLNIVCLFFIVTFRCQTSNLKLN